MCTTSERPLIGGRFLFKRGPRVVHAIENMESVEKKRIRQQRYCRKNLEKIREKAKVYRENFTPEQRQRKRQRGLAYYHRKEEQIRIKRHLKRKNRSEEEKERERQKVRERLEKPETATTPCQF